MAQPIHFTRSINWNLLSFVEVFCLSATRGGQISQAAPAKSGLRYLKDRALYLVKSEWQCFEDKNILPTGEQGKACIRVCQYLTNFYRPIDLIRFDERTGIVYLFAGEDLQVVIYRDGQWRFK